MKQVLLATSCSLVLLAGVVGAQAQSADKGPVVQNSQAMAAADQDAKPMNVRQQIQDQMTKAGYTDVTVMPSSFYVHAKDKKGDPVAMVIGPDTFTEVTELPMAKATSGTTTGTPPVSTTEPAAKP